MTSLLISWLLPYRRRYCKARLATVVLAPMSPCGDLRAVQRMARAWMRPRLKNIGSANFTMADEYLPHALAAVQLLRQQPQAAPDRIHLLGHSTGGKVAPRIAAADRSVAGLVLLAADTQPMHEGGVGTAPAAPAGEQQRCGRWRDHRQLIDGLLAKSDRSIDSGGERNEGLGCSRGGFTNEIHRSADGLCRPLPLIVTAGQRVDCTQFAPVLEKIRVPRLGTGRPRKNPDSVMPHKAYSNSSCRPYMRQRGIRHTIPEKTDRKAARLRQGSRGGRPPGFDKDRYRERNTVERARQRTEELRAVATRYDKRGYVCLDTITAAALVIWLRT
ncbi:IS5 family transposase [Streptomyces sp. NPDC059649]|uniref:IS5 family transposase n=1 Tax=Streptomyces sp. NPDC059649 TaxID=3346895 RepID=UPI003698CCAD